MEQGLPGLNQEGLAELCFLWVMDGLWLTKRTIQLLSELLPSSPQRLGCRVSEAKPHLSMTLLHLYGVKWLYPRPAGTHDPGIASHTGPM